MAAPRQMTANTLNALKGWPSQSAVDYVSTIDATQLAGHNSGVTLAGTVVSLGADGEYEIGVGELDRMPLFLFNNSDDPDVANDGGDAGAGGDKGVWVPVSPSGNMMALVATGAYELTTTQFAGATGTFTPNTPLKADKYGVGNAGKVEASAFSSTAFTIVGVVSRNGYQDNGYGVDCVAFWPYFLPKSINELS